MQKSVFDIYRQDVIEKYINDLLKLDNVDCLKYKQKSIDKIYKNYELKRLEIRRFFMNFEKKPMDRHKIGAVMIYAVLKSKIFKINKRIPNLPDEMLMANEYLAIYLALSIVESYKRDELKDEEWLLRIPNTYHENNTENKEIYINNMSKALYNIPNIKYFDIFAYSNVLFLLEKYTDTINNKNTV